MGKDVRPSNIAPVLVVCGLVSVIPAFYGFGRLTSLEDIVVGDEPTGFFVEGGLIAEITLKEIGIPGVQDRSDSTPGISISVGAPFREFETIV